MIYSPYFMAIGAAMSMTGAGARMFFLYRIVKADAERRGMKHPTFWGFMSISGNNSGGLILYLAKRKSHPIIRQNPRREEYIDKNKKKFGVGLIFLVIGAIIFIISLINITGV